MARKRNPFVEEGFCVCGELLVGGDILVMRCCFRRIHVQCMIDWAQVLRKAHRHIWKHEGDDKDLHQQQKAVLHPFCDCGEDTPQDYTPHPVFAEIKQYEAMVWENTHHIRAFEQLVEKVPEQIMGAFGEDKHFITKGERIVPPALTNMKWSRGRKD